MGIVYRISRHFVCVYVSFMQCSTDYDLFCCSSLNLVPCRMSQLADRKQPWNSLCVTRKGKPCGHAHAAAPAYENCPTVLSLVTLTGRCLAPYTVNVTPYNLYMDVLTFHRVSSGGYTPQLPTCTVVPATGLYCTCTKHVMCPVRAVSLTTAFPRRLVAVISPPRLIVVYRAKVCVCVCVSVCVCVCFDHRHTR